MFNRQYNKLFAYFNQSQIATMFLLFVFVIDKASAGLIVAGEEKEVTGATRIAALICEQYSSNEMQSLLSVNIDKQSIDSVVRLLAQQLIVYCASTLANKTCSADLSWKNNFGLAEDNDQVAEDLVTAMIWKNAFETCAGDSQSACKP